METQTYTNIENFGIEEPERGNNAITSDGPYINKRSEEQNVRIYN
jgi:hypothetical protein